MFELRKLVKAVKGDLGSITQPALILHPREDDRASLRNAHYLEWNLGGRVETVVLEDSYHVITLDRQRDVVLEKTLSFARGGGWSRSAGARARGGSSRGGGMNWACRHLLLRSVHFIEHHLPWAFTEDQWVWIRGRFRRYGGGRRGTHKGMMEHGDEYCSRTPRRWAGALTDEAELLALEARYCSHGDTVHYTEPPKIFERCEG